MLNPLISVVIPIYNSDLYLSECLLSIIEQSYKNLEIILIDDNSSDYSSMICKKFLKIDSRIVYYHNKENLGVSESRNIGIKLSTGDLIAFVDNDDILDKDFYFRAANAFEEYPNIDLYCCNFLNLPTFHRRNSIFFSNIHKSKLIEYNKFDTAWFYIWNKVFRNTKESIFEYKYDEDIFFIEKYIGKNSFLDNYIGYYHLLRADSAGALNKDNHPYWDRMRNHL